MTAQSFGGILSTVVQDHESCALHDLLNASTGCDERSHVFAGVLIATAKGSGQRVYDDLLEFDTRLLLPPATSLVSPFTTVV